MKKVITILFAIAILAGGMITPAGAALQAVGPVNPATGYPIWYEDATGLRLELCLDQNGMCLFVLPNPALPPSVPGNWDPAGESFYYLAAADIATAQVDASLIIALESAFLGGILPGGQDTFARIRISINPRDPIAANSVFTVTHPFGTTTLTTRNVNQNTAITQDVGIGIAVSAVNPPGSDALPNDPAQAGTVNVDGASIGPFLLPTTPRVVRPEGVYLATPGVPVTVTGGPNGNAFTIAGPITETTNLFDVQAKVSGCAVGNTAPVAIADPGAAAASGVAKAINLVANDTPGTTPGPPVAPVAINPGSIAITVAPTGGTAVPNLNGTVTYTPNPTFFGTDTFTYTVQDNCGLVSNPMVVPVIVEQLATTNAEFRAKTGKWTVTGTTSNTDAANVITLRKGNTVTGPVIGTTNVKADGTFKFSGKSKTALPGTPAQPQNINVESSATVNVTAPLKMR